MNKSSFAAFKSNAANLTEKLQGKLQADKSFAGNKDDRFWTCARDKAGNGYAVIRFLPPAPNPEMPNGQEDCFYVKMFSHAFQGKGGWYIENSLSTIDKSDPCGDYNSTLWNAGVESLKDQARKQKRKTQYISNILVINDSANPENNGKVFLYKYGKKIFEKINDKMFPQFPGDPKFNPFDFWTGANFFLKIREVEKFPNYDKAEFDKQSALSDDDAELERIWNLQYPLLPLIHPSQFKSYDELKKRLDKALGLTTSSRSRNDESGDDDNEDDKPVFKAREEEPLDRPTPKSVDEDADDEMAFFKSLANKK